MLAKSLLICVLLVASLAQSYGRIRETRDAIIIEAEDDVPARQGRQSLAVPFPVPVLFPGPVDELKKPVPELPVQENQRACWDLKGEVGDCVSVDTCYPYVKLPYLSNLESVVLGTNARCTFLEKSGRQVYGVCCSKSAKTSPSQFDSGALVPVAKFPWWPFSSLGKKQNQEPSSVVVDTLKPQPTFAADPIAVPGNATNRQFGTCGVGPSIVPSADDDQRIVGGYAAQPNSWPFIVEMVNGNRQFCGGSLIDNVHVLTAAHCIAHMSSWDVARLTVKLGAHHIRQDAPGTITKKVRRVTRHKNFDSRTLYNDVAILTMDSPISYTDTINPVCLPTGQELYTSRDAVVIGWGSLTSGGRQPDVLQQVTVKVQTNEECKSKYGNDAPGGIIDTFVCAAAPGKDSCSGDSGGPLVVQSGAGGPWVQVGIVSWGIGCAEAKYPGVYTRVTSFMSWIQNNLN